MTDSSAPSTTVNPLSTVAILRDPSFARFYADEILLVPHASQVELHFIVHGPDFATRANAEEAAGLYRPGKLSLAPTLTNVAQARVTNAALLAASMSLMGHLISEGEIDRQLLLDQIAAFDGPEAEPGADTKSTDPTDGPGDAR